MNNRYLYSGTKQFRITGLKVSGTIVDFDGQPISGAEINLNGQVVQTNDTGVYELENVAPDNHKIQISKTDWIFEIWSNPVIEQIKPSKVAVCPKTTL